MKNFFKTIVLILIIILPSMLSAIDRKLPGKHNIKDPERYLQSVDDRAVGLLDKGELSNLFSNYGVISEYHFGTPALHWPKNGTDVQHYGFGVSLILIADGEVISSIYDQSSAVLDYGWEAADGSNGDYFNSERNEFNTAGDEVTPFLAFSDRRETWPISNGIPFWPGYFRENLQEIGTPVEGEFVSDRDVFCVLQDTRNLGLVVKQTGYSYGRPYAENLIMIRFKLFNLGSTDFDSCYVGFQADLKPDFYADDFIKYWTMDDYSETPSFFWKWDYNGIAQRGDSSYFGENWEGPVGYIGMGMIDTPDSMGVTSFHYYNDDNSPVDNAYFTAMLSNNRDTTLEDIDHYFHGDSLNFDNPDTAYWGDLDFDSFPGSEITFTFGSGPFSLGVGDSVEFSIVFAIEEDSIKLRESAEMAYFMAMETAYQGSGPPDLPIVTGSAGDGEVKIFWDNHSESSIDIITLQQDFEGYKVYKSTDQGETWGEPITNFYGDRVGWVPIAQYDVIDSVTGIDPAYGEDFPNANNWLGNDTGLEHSFTDTDVTNGLETWYCVTAYDRGVMDSVTMTPKEQSYENVIGVSPYEINIIVVTPGTQPSDVSQGTSSTISEVNDLVADGDLELVIVDPAELKDADYQITFTDSTMIIDPVSGDTSWVIEFTYHLENITDGTFRFLNTFTGDSFDYVDFPLSGDDQPVVDGFRIYVKNIEGTGVRIMGWTTVIEDTCTFDWWTENRHPGNSSSFEEVVEGLDDWRITITDIPVPIPMTAAGFFDEPLDTTMLNIKVERLVYTMGGDAVDATEHLWISDLVFYFGPIPSLGPLGYDFVPGGMGYNPDPNTGTIWPDMLLLRDDENDTTGSVIYLKTQNGDSTTTPPSDGDVFTIETYKPFTSIHAYQFSTQASSQISPENLLKNIKVVPNPLIVASGLETDPYESKVMFTHLPTVCDITIYTVSGNKVVTLHHESSSNDGYTFWNLLNHQEQNVAYGLYIYVVKTPDGSKTTGKLMIIR